MTSVLEGAWHDKFAAAQAARQVSDLLSNATCIHGFLSMQSPYVK